LQVLKTWLLDIAKHLKSVDINTATDNGRRMCGVLVVTVLLSKVLHINADEISLLFSMLHLWQEPGCTEAKCADLNILMDFVSEQHYEEVSENLVKCANTIIPSASGVSEWIYVVPLIHIFQKKIEPFQSPALTSKDMKWFDPCIRLYQLKNTSIKISRYTLPVLS
jgi:hypothetical protein